MKQRKNLALMPCIVRMISLGEDVWWFQLSCSGKHSPEIVERAIKAAFERTDRQYMTKVYGAFELGFGRDTRAGSCALGVFVLDETMYVANAGDSRAVIGINRKAVAREDPRSLQKLQQQGVTSEGPTRSTTMEELDEDLEIAALRQSTGEYNISIIWSLSEVAVTLSTLICRGEAGSRGAETAEAEATCSSFRRRKRRRRAGRRKRRISRRKELQRRGRGCCRVQRGETVVVIQSSCQRCDVSYRWPNPTREPWVFKGRFAGSTFPIASEFMLVMQYIPLEMSQDHNCKHPVSVIWTSRPGSAKHV